MAKTNRHNEKTPGVTLRRIRKPGSVKTVQRKLWQAVLAAEDLLMSPGATFDDQLRAVHALVQAAGAYGKLLETTELRDQVNDLKAELDALRDTVKLRRVA